jgi:hypothetical protein
MTVHADAVIIGMGGREAQTEAATRRDPVS